MNNVAIITGLVNGTIIAQGQEQERIQNKLQEQFEMYKEHMDADASAEDWADEYGVDEVEEQVLADIQEAF